MKPCAPFILQWFNRCLLLLLLLSGPVSAQTINAPPTPDHPASVSGRASPAYVSQARKTIGDVLAEPEFDRTRIVKAPKLKESPNDKEKGVFDAFIEWLTKLLRGDSKNTLSNGNQTLALAGQVVLWLLAFGLVALLAIYSKYWLPFFGWRRFRANLLPPVQQTDSVLEISEALPEDIATAAERRWKDGQKEEALSLLYRGTIELLTAHHRIDLPQGATEEEIRQIIGCAMPAFKDDFGNIARAWLRLAYAHRPPADIVGLLAGFSRLQQTGGAVS